ncbi:Uncharacterised protein [Metamycoplasma alkalescens]|uniref:Uncharacterized protein n=1 Tax=Metamycoplasma alkalescens TaxID=45363 RepID=A0A3B0PIP7_9BACT|nr:Uncharacterised protein [Metamycoplasma alkalescens]
MLPYSPPAIMKSLGNKVPFSTMTVATIPLPLSIFDSMTVPKASRFKLAFSSNKSACKNTASNKSSIFFSWAAEP